jgi:hypothetical protein
MSSSQSSRLFRGFPLFLGVALVVPALACGGAVDPTADITHPPPPPVVTPSPPTPSAPPTPPLPPLDAGPPPFDAGPLPPGVLALVPPAPSCDAIEGWSPHDLWCLRATDVLHWDGAAWGNPIAVPLPAGDGVPSLSGSYAPFPGVLFVATTYGVARIHPDGTNDDLTPAGFAGARSVAVTAVDGTVYLSRDKAIYSLKGSAWQSAGADVTGDTDIGGLAGADGAVWGWGTYYGAFVARASGGTWTIGQPPAALRVWYNRAFVGSTLWAMPDDPGGHYCPDWCHPGAPPQHEALVTPWSLWTVDEKATFTQVAIDVPADVPTDGSVEYQGRAVRKSASGQLTLLGCVTPRPPSPKNPYVVVHTWDGAHLGAGRNLPPEVACPSVFGTGMNDALTDGTWILPSAAPSGGIALVSP